MPTTNHPTIAGDYNLYIYICIYIYIYIVLYVVIVYLNLIDCYVFCQFKHLYLVNID